MSVEGTDGFVEEAMNTCILCVDDNGSRASDCQKNLENAGFAVSSARDEAQALELLNSCSLDVVCVDSRIMKRGATRVGAQIRRLRPNVRIVLICNDKTIPPGFQEYADVIIDDSEFNQKAHWLIDRLQDIHYPFFMEWFSEWKRRGAGSSVNETVQTLCNA